MDAANKSHLVTFFLLLVLVISIINAYYFIRLYSAREGSVTGLNSLTAGGALILAILDIVIVLATLSMLIYRYTHRNEDKKAWFSNKLVVFLFLLLLLVVNGMNTAWYFFAIGDAFIEAGTGSSRTPFDGLSKGGATTMGTISSIISVTVLVAIIYNFMRK